jgi:hypothetical protein
MIRDFPAEGRVAARLEITSGSWLRGREAGLDVMGDGNLVAYHGAIFRKRLDPGGGESPFELVREALRG